LEAEIIVTQKLEHKLFELVKILYDEEYFGFVIDAENYVDNIYDFISTIPLLKQRKCFNTRYGDYFVRYDNAKSKMQYFITFSKSGRRYLIEDIISPKTPEYWYIFGN
jgi:hypothetical protein